MDTAAFWVGPRDEPGRYRLTHLLGSGGEGEVWRAVRAGTDEREVAVKIDALPTGAGDAWEHRLGALTSLEVSGLVRVEETFVGVARHRADDVLGDIPTHRYVVMNHVPGLTLRTWLDEHPDATPRQRIRILRGVAATLSDLHRGRQGPITHGDVKPTNIIISTDGAPVLVDLGLLRPAGAGPASGRTAAYSSPELRNPDGRPGPRTDTFSFAVTAMETLTGLTPPLLVDGSLDLEGTRARVASAPALRARPLLRRQLLRSLTPEPERRPGTPVRVFAGRTLVLTLVPLLVVLGAGGSAIAMRTGDHPTAGPAVVHRSVQPSPVPRVTVDPPLPSGPTTSAPVAPASGAVPPPPSPSPTTTATAVVHLVDTGQILNGRLIGDADPELHTDCGARAGNVVVPQDLTSWGRGAFQLVLSAKHDLHVLSVNRKTIDARTPAKVVQQLGVTCPVGIGPPQVSPPAHHCPPASHAYRTDASYRADADSGAWREVVGHDDRPFGVLEGSSCNPTSVISLVTDDCRTNVDYQVTVKYELVGDPGKVYTRTFPAIHLRAKVTSGTFETSLDGLIYRFPFSGGPAGCRDHGITRTVPYASVPDAIYTVLVNRVADIRKDHPTMTTAEAVDAVVKDLERGGTRTMPSGFTTTDLLDVCRRAAADPARWRGTCGPADSPTG